MSFKWEWRNKHFRTVQNESKKIYIVMTVFAWFLGSIHFCKIYFIFCIDETTACPYVKQNHSDMIYSSCVPRYRECLFVFLLCWHAMCVEACRLSPFIYNKLTVYPQKLPSNWKVQENILFKMHALVNWRLSGAIDKGR